MVNIYGIGGTVAEWSKALQLREKINKNQNDPRLTPQPVQPLKKSINCIGIIESTQIKFTVENCSEVSENCRVLRLALEKERRKRLKPRIIGSSKKLLFPCVGFLFSN